MNTIHALVGLALMATFARESAAQAVYTRQHDVLVDAIRNGHAEGTLQGPADDLFTRQFKSTAPLQVTAEVIRSYPREGCKRLRMVYTKPGVQGRDGPTALTLDTQLNYCLDGRPPVNLEKSP